FAKFGRRKPEDARIVFFVDVVEDDVELLFLLGEKLECVANLYRDAISDTSSLEVAAGLLSVLGVPVGVDHTAALSQSAGPPNGRVADGGAHLEYLSSITDQRKLMQNTPNRRTN